MPVNYRLVNKQEKKTKHEHFLEMLIEGPDWGLKPAMVTGDSWYASKENLNFLKDKEISGLFAIKSNRLVAIKPQEK